MICPLCLENQTMDDERICHDCLDILVDNIKIDILNKLVVSG